MTLQQHISSIPAWRRWLICCVFCRKQWKLARAYSEVAVDQLHGSDWHLGDRLRTLSDYKWANLYGFEMPPLAKSEDFEARAIRAEMHLDTNRMHIERLENQIQIMKNTNIGLKNLREQKRLPSSV